MVPCTRQSLHGRSGANYDSKLHMSLDAVIRPTHYRKRMRLSGSTDLMTDDDDDNDVYVEEASPPKPLTREPDPAAVRQSKRSAAKQSHEYRATHHPQDEQIYGRTWNPVKRRRRLKTTAAIGVTPSAGVGADHHDDHDEDDKNEADSENIEIDSNDANGDNGEIGIDEAEENDKDSDDVEDQKNEHVEDESNEHVEDQINAHVEDQINTHVEDQINTHVEDQINEYVEGQDNETQVIEFLVNREFDHLFYSPAHLDAFRTFEQTITDIGHIESSQAEHDVEADIPTDGFVNPLVLHRSTSTVLRPSSGEASHDSDGDSDDEAGVKKGAPTNSRSSPGAVRQ